MVGLGVLFRHGFLYHSCFTTSWLWAIVLLCYLSHCQSAHGLHTYIYMCISINLYIYMGVYLHRCIYLGRYMGIYVYSHVHMNLHICVWVCVYIFICLGVCIYVDVDVPLHMYRTIYIWLYAYEYKYIPDCLYLCLSVCPYTSTHLHEFICKYSYTHIYIFKPSSWFALCREGFRLCFVFCFNGVGLFGLRVMLWEGGCGMQGERGREGEWG